MRSDHELLDALGSFGRVFGNAARLLARRWPILVALFLAGAAVRGGVLWLTTEVSRFSAVLAVLVLPIAPLATLFALVLMMRAVGPDLPAFSEEFQAISPRSRARKDVGVAAQVLIPFLAVYATQGLLAQDTQRYVRSANADEVARYDILGADYGRVDYATNVVLVVSLVVVVLILRKVLSYLKLPEKGLGWSAAGGYLEALWMVSLVTYFTSSLDHVTEWVMSRRAVDTVGDWFLATLGSWGGFGRWLLSTGAWLSETLSSMGAWIVVPISWLAIAASIFGRELGKKADAGESEGDQTAASGLETHEEATAKIRRIAQPVRRVTTQAVEPITTPVKNTVASLKRVAVAGVLPMFVFCVIFTLADQLKVGVAWLMRRLVGGQNLAAQMAWEPYYELAGRLVFTVVVVVLATAAVDVVVRAQRERDAADEAAAAALAGDSRVDA